MERIGYVAASLISLAVVAASAAGAVTAREPASAPPAAVVGQGSDRYPSETLSDWVSYADQVSAVTAVSEQELPAPPEVYEHGEGYLPRAITLSIDETIWRRDSAPTVAGIVRVVDEGWVLRDGGNRHPFAIAGALRITVGQRYLVPLVLTPEGGWTVLSPGSKLALLPDRTAQASTDPTGHPTAARALSGMTMAQIADVLAGTAPDPVAAEYAHLDPDARRDAVAREPGR